MVEAGIAEVEAARSDARKTVPDPKDRILSTSMLLALCITSNVYRYVWIVLTNAGGDSNTPKYWFLQKTCNLT